METVFRDIRKEEEAQVSNFMVRIFNEFVAPGYSEEGIMTFLNSSGVEQLHRRLKRGDFVQVADKQGEIVGAIEVRDNSHISRFFVEGKYQRQGIGRELLRRVLPKCRKLENGSTCLTVNSSPNAVRAYEKLGFRALDDERTENGIRYTPMRLNQDEGDQPGRGK